MADFLLWFGMFLVGLGTALVCAPVLARRRWAREHECVCRAFEAQQMDPATEQRVLQGLEQALGHHWFDPSNLAQRTSIKLLESWLTPRQLEQFQKTMQFDVIGSTSGKCYRIVPANNYNIHELDKDGQLIYRLCVGPRGVSSFGDIMLAQKIGLETDEPRVLALANVHPPIPSE